MKSENVGKRIRAYSYACRVPVRGAVELSTKFGLPLDEAKFVLGVIEK